MLVCSQPNFSTSLTTSCNSCAFVVTGLTKLVSRLSREGHWQKGLEVFEALPHMGLTPDTTITNAAISACDRGICN